jgi:acyl-CoA thioesterase I
VKSDGFQLFQRGYVINKILLAAIVAAYTLECCALTKIACIGNSITYGYRLGNPSSQSYPGRLQALLGTADYSVQNNGVNSTTMSKKGDISYWTKGQLQQVFTFQPAIVTIKLGTNDTKSKNWDALGYGTQYKRDCLAMVDTLAAMASHPKIFLVLPVPVFDNAKAVTLGIRDSVIQKEIPILKEVAAARGLAIIDANTPLLKIPQYFSVDGVHPDAAGEDTIAHIVFRALKATSVSAPAFRPRIPITIKTNNDILVSSPGMAPSSIEALDVTGKLLKEYANSGLAHNALFTGNLHSGVYIIRMASGPGGKLIKLNK